MRRSFWLAALLLSCGESTPKELSAADLMAKVDSQRFSADLEAASGVRTPGTDKWQQVQDLCADRLAALGYTVERQTYATGVNVIGTKVGTTQPQQQVLISAHYDGVGNCSAVDDNASGVAGALEVARVLSLRSFDKTIQVACWDEEERGLIGSKAFVARAKAAAELYDAVFVFEMIGFRSTEPNSQQLAPGIDMLFPQQTAAIQANGSRGDFIAAIHDEAAGSAVAAFSARAAEVGLSVVALPVPEAMKRSLRDLRRSDHAPFWDANYPAIQLTDTANYRNPHYHCTSGEDSIATIDNEFATANIKAVVGAVVDLAQARL